MKTISELSDEDLSRWISEKLEPANTLPEALGHFSPKGLWRVWTDYETTCWSPRDIVNDPAMTVMLLEKLHAFGNVVLAGDNGWGVHVHHINENGVDISYVNPSQTNSPTIGRAVAEAFALANDWQA